MDEATRVFVASCIRRLPPPQRVVEFGSRDVNGSVRPLFGDCQYIGVDVVEGDSVDVVSRAEFYRPETAPDVVVCCNMLEHAQAPEAVIERAFEILAEDGALILATVLPGYPEHAATGGPLPAGEYYGAPTELQIRRWLRPFNSVHVAVDPNRQTIYALAGKAGAVIQEEELDDEKAAEAAGEAPKDEAPRGDPIACGLCHRAIFRNHADADGHCVFCAQPVPQAKPEKSKGASKA